MPTVTNNVTTAPFDCLLLSCCDGSACLHGLNGSLKILRTTARIVPCIQYKRHLAATGLMGHTMYSSERRLALVGLLLLLCGCGLGLLPSIIPVGHAKLRVTPKTPSIAPDWRLHFIFRNSTGQLHACPDSGTWPSGLWTRPTSTEQQVLQAAASSNESTAPQNLWKHRRAARPGEASVLPHTLLAQQAIWRHQHPAKCEHARFLLYLGWTSGFGSLLHVQTTALAAAIESGRVLVEAAGQIVTRTPYCGTNNTMDSCYFLPLSNCSMQQANITPAEISNAPVLTGFHGLRKLLDPALHAARVVTWAMAQAGPARDFVPTVFNRYLDSAGVPGDRRFWWWRAQGVAFIVRPNARTVQEIRQRLTIKLRGESLQQGCISLFVRHGDKATEDKVYEDPEYETAVRKLLEIDASLTRQLFLSTEDPDTVTYFTDPARKWKTTYIDMPRKPDRTKSNLDYMAKHGFHEEVLDSLLNLDLNLQCDGFVASFLSNWSRLIEELRATVRCKAEKVFVDVGNPRPQGPVSLSW